MAWDDDIDELEGDFESIEDLEDDDFSRSSQKQYAYDDDDYSFKDEDDEDSYTMD